MAIALRFIVVLFTISSSLTWSFKIWAPDKCPKVCSCSVKFSEWLQSDLRTVDCSNEGLSEIPIVDLPTDVQVFILADNKLTQIFALDDPSSIFLHDLLHLDLSRNLLDSLGSDSRLRELYSLKILDLSHNRLSSLVDFSFGGLLNLERLNLAHNSITDAGISEKAFHGLLKLHVLELTGNQLEYVQPMWWSNSFLQSLHELRLDGNHLLFLQADSFDNLPTLRRLDLGRNKLSRLHQNAFRGLVNLQILNLDYNRLTTVPTESLIKVRRHLQSLNLNHNPVVRLRSFDFADFPRLKDISCNYMSNLLFIERSTFKNLPELLIFESHDNPQLSYLDDHAFVDVFEMTHLFLHNNNLTGLSATVLKPFEKLEQLTLYGNPLACDCTTKWLRMEIEQSELNDLDNNISNETALSKPFVIRDIDRMICNSPPEHKFKLFAQLDTDEIGDECAPRIVVMHQSISQHSFSGRQVRLDCKAVGLPKPKIFWLTPDQVVVNELTSGEHPENEKFLLRHQGETLIIGHVDMADTGVYSCMAENSLGRMPMDELVKIQKVTIGQNFDIFVTQITDTAAQISWPMSLNHQVGEIQHGRLSLAYTSLLVDDGESSLPSSKTKDTSYLRKNFIRLPYAVNKHALKHLQPETLYEACLTIHDDNDIMYKFQCVKFKTQKTNYDTKVNIGNLDSAEKLGNLAIGVTLAVMVLVLIVLTIVVLVLKNRQNQYRQNRSAFAAMVQADNLVYVATPIDCKRFIFDDKTMAASASTTLSSQQSAFREFDQSSAYSAFHESRGRMVIV